MPDIKVYLDDDEMEFVRRQDKGYIRSVVRRFMDTENALTAEELAYLKAHGGTHGVIRIAQNLQTPAPQVDPDTGELR